MKKGIQITILDKDSANYSFNDIKCPIGTSPVNNYTLNVLTDNNITQPAANQLGESFPKSYSKNEIIQYNNPNSRQYYRESSLTSSIFDKKSENFEIVSRTFYPQQNFNIYKDNTIYVKDETVEYLEKLYKAKKNFYSTKQTRPGGEDLLGTSFT